MYFIYRGKVDNRDFLWEVLNIILIDKDFKVNIIFWKK